ncbi:MAG: hypothetical protein ACM3TR_16330 [Caulobacteraceae bacterium]
MFTELGNNIIAYVDDGGQIEKEWEQSVEPEWFSAWFARMLIEDRIREIAPINSVELRKKLLDFGFPVNTKDMWYIKTAKSVSVAYEKAYFIIDFFDPTQKTASGKRRLSIIKSSNAPVSKYLRSEAIELCLRQHVMVHSSAVSGEDIVTFEDDYGRVWMMQLFGPYLLRRVVL